MSLHRNEKNFLLVNDGLIEQLCQETVGAPNHMARLLMHNAPEQYVQEMLIAFTDQTLIKPNHSMQKSESLTVIKGDVRLIIFTDDGQLKDVLDLGVIGSGKPFLYRFNSTPWHMMIAMSEVAVVHEAIQGPFVKAVEVNEPLWLPKDQEVLLSLTQRYRDEALAVSQ